jgi:hypothetical protein
VAASGWRPDPGIAAGSGETDVKRLVSSLAFLSSLAACIVVVGGGLTLLAIENSGERFSGALLALGGSVAFAATMILIFARRGAFAGPGGRVGALAAGVLGTLPMAAICMAALRFSGLPYASPVPLVDWPVFGVGVVLALGAASVLALGIIRMREFPARAPVAAPAAMAQPLPPRPSPRRLPERPAEARPTIQERPERLRLRPAEWQEEDLGDEDIHVTPVELPSIGRFRRH